MEDLTKKKQAEVQDKAIDALLAAKSSENKSFELSKRRIILIFIFAIILAVFFAAYVAALVKGSI